jgi:alpha-D-ribose 1-methylphosphonate 5-triphosphate synthase subunit PhnL
MRLPVGFLSLAAVAVAVAAGAGIAAEPAAGIGKKDINVLVLVYDPVLKTQGNLKLHEHMHWSDPYKITLKLVEDLREASYGYVNYHVVEMIEFDGYPTKRNGFTYDEASFLAVTKDP